MKKILLIITLLLTILNSQDLNKISDKQPKEMIGQMLIIGFEENEVNKNSQIISTAKSTKSKSTKIYKH